ncbi:tripartite tricarboxylate transporter permease [Candidatus Woesearchaeota archaeon]|nr:tripartite tricarboxylate transporter permease [Candidatus Woesearchaeota archaeon]
MEPSLFLQFVLGILVGIAAGIITGLIPGVHINLVAVMLISLSTFFLRFVHPLTLGVAIVAMSVTHTFLDTIPSIFLGAPESETALGVLPGHRYLLKGHGFLAVQLTIVGSFGALLLSILFFPLFVPLAQWIYPLIKEYVGYLLIAVACFMILRDRKKIWALILFLISGIFGVLVLTYPGLSDPLFPMLSGLFGISTLLVSLFENEHLPPQEYTSEIPLQKATTCKALLSGQFSGWLTSLLPGLGAAQAAIISLQLTRKLGDQGFMILLGSINTVSFVLSLVTFYVLDKARNGSVVALQHFIDEPSMNVILLFLASALVAGSIGMLLAIFFGKLFANLIMKVNYHKLIIGVMLLVIILVGIVTGWIGLFILLISTAIGIIPAILKTQRTHAMGCLLLPVILFFIL